MAAQVDDGFIAELTKGKESLNSVEETRFLSKSITSRKESKAGVPGRTGGQRGQKQKEDVGRQRCADANMDGDVPSWPDRR